MQCTWQTRSGIGGDRGADRGILAARMQGAEPAGNDVSTHLDGMKAHAARAHARLKSIGVPTHERIWWLPDHPYHHAVTLLPCCHEHHRPAPEFAIDSLLEQAGFEPLVPLRTWCRSRGPNDRGFMPHLSVRPLFLRRDLGFESAFLQRGVCLSSEPSGCRRKVPHVGGGLRVAGDVRRDAQAANGDSFALSL